MTRWREAAIPLALAAAVLAVPLVVKNPYHLNVAILVLVWTTLGAAWNIVGGYAGQLSLGHAAFFGIGAYSLALTAHYWGWSPWAGMAMAVAVSVPLAAAIGAITFRLRGPYFVLGTLALAEVLRLVVLAWRDLTYGAAGIMVPEIFPGLSRAPYYYFIALAAIAAVGTTWWMERSGFGYYLTAIREDQETAESIGVNAAWYKNLALMISAAFTALTGAFYASHLMFIEPDIVLSEPVSVQMAVVAIIGGRGTVLGPLVGALLLVLASEIFRAQFQQAHLLIYGLLLMLTILFMPGGVLGEIQHRLRLRAAPRPVIGTTFSSSHESSGQREVG
ncbi:MAG: branched-chain amino acid ABC transporter permease [Firmicutes bacterium]|nr:branched-chain amino acid ABC transporter permease [Bacillota bacterium]